jgi:RNA polymerase sigma-70 factor, ECF subfamily
MSDFHLLLEEQIPGLMRYARALARDAEQAGDLVEDTVREALASRTQWLRDSDFSVWLLTILHDHRDNPFRQPPSRLDPLPAATLTLSALDRALGALPEKQRALILLVGLEGLSYPQTAAILRMSVGAMRSQLSAARASLRRLLGVEGRARRLAARAA